MSSDQQRRRAMRADEREDRVQEGAIGIGVAALGGGEQFAPLDHLVHRRRLPSRHSPDRHVTSMGCPAEIDFDDDRWSSAGRR